MRAWASEPSMSNSASRWSKETDALKRCVRRSRGSAKRPDHALPAIPAGRLVVLLHGSGGNGQIGDRGEYKSDGCGHPVAELLQPRRDAAFAWSLVNALLVAAAVIRAPSVDGIWFEFLVFAAFGEPVLIVSPAWRCAPRGAGCTRSATWARSSLLALFELAVTWVLYEVSPAVHAGRPAPMTFGQVDVPRASS